MDNTEKFSWDKLTETYETLLGKGSFLITSDKLQGVVTHKNAILAIFQKIPGKVLTLHLRSTLTPNVAGYVSSFGYFVEDFKIGENFSVNEETGEWLYGLEAMEYAKANLSDMWDATIEIAKKLKAAKNKEVVKDDELEKNPSKFLN